VYIACRWADRTDFVSTVRCGNDGVYWGKRPSKLKPSAQLPRVRVIYVTMTGGGGVAVVRVGLAKNYVRRVPTRVTVFSETTTTTKVSPRLKSS